MRRKAAKKRRPNKTEQFLTDVCSDSLCLFRVRVKKKKVHTHKKSRSGLREQWTRVCQVKVKRNFLNQLIRKLKNITHFTSRRRRCRCHCRYGSSYCCCCRRRHRRHCRRRRECRRRILRERQFCFVRMGAIPHVICQSNNNIQQAKKQEHTKSSSEKSKRVTETQKI